MFLPRSLPLVIGRFFCHVYVEDGGQGSLIKGVNTPGYGTLQSTEYSLLSGGGGIQANLYFDSLLFWK